MDIRRPNELKAFAGERLSAAGSGRRLVMLYCVVTLGLALAVTAINYVLNLQIDKTGGLSNMGTRAVLDTLTRVLPLVQSMVGVCMELGLIAAMLRIARGQYVSEKTLKLGFDRFWPLLRLTLIRGLIFVGVGFAAMYAGITLYLLTPLSEPVMEILRPLVSGGMVDPNALLEGDLYGRLVSAMTPCFVICGLIYALAAGPMWYSYRMASHVLIDKPALGALMALAESRKLMHRNRLNLLKLDLSLWYYYLPLFLAGFVAYGELLLSLVGITLPLPEVVAFFGFYVLYLGAQLALNYFLRPQVEVSYCLAYDAIRPKEPEQSSVVLGNIFQM